MFGYLNVDFGLSLVSLKSIDWNFYSFINDDLDIVYFARKWICLSWMRLNMKKAINGLENPWYSSSKLIRYLTWA